MDVKVTPEMISELGKGLRPGQSIGQDKLYAKLSDEWSMNRFYATKREMQRRGMITEQLRQGAPTLYTFHNPPLTGKDRQTPPTKNRPNGAAVDINSGTSSKKGKVLYATKVTRTFEIQGGTYTAEELRNLATAVLKHLKEI